MNLGTTLALLGIFLNPSKEKVSETQTQHNGQAQPIVEGHKDQHEQVGDNDLQQIQQGLYDVRRSEDALPVGLLSHFRQRCLRAAAAVACLALLPQLGGHAFRLLACLSPQQMLPQELEQFVQKGDNKNGYGGEHELGNCGRNPASP